MSSRNRRAVVKSDFYDSCLDCIEELNNNWEGVLVVCVQPFKGEFPVERLFWVVAMHLPDKGVLERRIKRETGLMVSQYSGDPYATLYDVLMRLLRALEQDRQAAFWRRHP